MRLGLHWNVTLPSLALASLLWLVWSKKCVALSRATSGRTGAVAHTILITCGCRQFKRRRNISTKVIYHLFLTMMLSQELRLLLSDCRSLPSWTMRYHPDCMITKDTNMPTPNLSAKWNNDQNKTALLINKPLPSVSTAPDRALVRIKHKIIRHHRRWAGSNRI